MRLDGKLAVTASLMNEALWVTPAHGIAAWITILLTGCYERTPDPAVQTARCARGSDSTRILLDDRVQS